MSIEKSLLSNIRGNSIAKMLDGSLIILTPDNIRNYVPQYAIDTHADLKDLLLATGMATKDWTITQIGTHLVFKYKGIEKYRIEV